MKAGGTRAGAAPENRDGGRRAVVERLKEYGQTRADSDWNDRLVMGDAIAQLPQSVQRPMGLLARQGRAVRERAPQRRPPERHLVVRPAAIRVHAAAGPEQRHPEAERERSHKSCRRRCSFRSA